MHYKISMLAKEEYALHMKRIQFQEFSHSWRENVRGLQKLYELRETFLLQVGKKMKLGGGA